MYRIEKRFTIAGGHRLSKHKGRCFSLHGHNYAVLVGIKSPKLDENDMVIDFTDLKKHVNEILDPLDHCMLVNSCDMDSLEPFIERGMRIMTIGECDPTAERIAEKLFLRLREKFYVLYKYIQIDYVTVYENENSKATYSEE
jgi:6-pyruvoyltetrahydropterin/6-carboxytetrahydropterin synthase